MNDSKRPRSALAGCRVVALSPCRESAFASGNGCATLRRAGPGRFSVGATRPSVRLSFGREIPAMRLLLFLLAIGISVCPPQCRGNDELASTPPTWSVVEALRRWEQATLAVQPVSDLERSQMQSLHGAPYTGHELAVAIEFRGRVTAEELRNRYNWTKIEPAVEEIRLTGHPWGVEERLFCPGFEVRLNRETFLPVSVAFFDRNGALRAPRLFLLTEYRIPTHGGKPKPVPLAADSNERSPIQTASLATVRDRGRSGRVRHAAIAAGRGVAQHVIFREPKRMGRLSARRLPIAPVGQVMVVSGAGFPLLFQPLFGLGDDFVLLLQLQFAQ